MKLLLDENIDVKFRYRLTGHDVATVRSIGWAGSRNGELMQLLLSERYDAMITLDKGFAHQQNFTKYPVSIILLRPFRSEYPFLLPFVPQLLELLGSTLPTGVIELRPA